MRLARGALWVRLVITGLLWLLLEQSELNCCHWAPNWEVP